MKCLETEKLIGYAYGLSDESAASQVRAHLRECPRCREIVEEHRRLDAVLGEWKVAGPTADFEARVRQAVEARRAAWNFWSWQWTRGLAVASLGIMIVAGVALLRYNPGRISRPSQNAARLAQRESGARTLPPAANLHSPSDVAKSSAHVVPESPSAGANLSDDKDAQALEDYDLAANFDLLSELPRTESRVAN
jgi:anti-sigma factor RsiW